MSNRQLSDEIRDYWSKRSETFDLSFGHRIGPNLEAKAWAAPMRAALGDRPKQVLELACGTGEITGLVHALGHEVTALDFSPAMLARAKSKHCGKSRLRFLEADAQNTMEPNARYDTVLCRHLVWTLTEPERAFQDWYRVLRPGGVLLVYDGNWARPSKLGHVAAIALRLWDSLAPEENHESDLSTKHAAIMRALPFGQGLTFETIAPLLDRAGFTAITKHSHGPIAKAQRRENGLRNGLRTRVYERFILAARKDR